MEGWEKGITKIEVVSDLGFTPARVNHRTGVMTLSRKHMLEMPKEHRLFVMLHEMGHVVCGTKDEEKADEWAFNEYAKRGYSLKGSVTALTQVLCFENPEHAWRMYKELRRAEEYDYRVNGNKKVEKYVRK